MVAADIYRPAAIDQLKVLGQTLGVDVFSVPGQMPQQPGPPGAPQQMNPDAMSPQQKYAMACGKILPSVNERNPYLK